MQGVPSIGGTRGIFDIFVPGAFLLINVFWVVYACADDSSEIRNFIEKTVAQPMSGLAVLVCFGYLLGAILRLLKTRLPDKWSGLFNSFLNRKKPSAENFKEDFPYFDYIGRLVKTKLPEETRKFYDEFWNKKPDEDNRENVNHKDKRDNREFFNHCKTVLNSIDDRAVAEINAAEALVRYLASMFFALLISSILMIVAAIMSSHAFWILFLAYVIGLLIILMHLRFLRSKEVQTVFTAVFCNYVTGKWPTWENSTRVGSGCNDAKPMENSGDIQ